MRQDAVFLFAWLFFSLGFVPFTWTSFHTSLAPSTAIKVIHATCLFYLHVYRLTPSR